MATVLATKLINPSPELSYVIGAILGDGDIRKTKANNKHGSAYGICLRVKDRDFVEKVDESVCLIKKRENPYPIKEERDSKTAFGKGTHFRLDFYSKEIYKILENKNTALEVARKFPTDFIRGFADAEGSVHHGIRKSRRLLERKIQIRNTNLGILTYISKELRKLGIKSEIPSPTYSPIGTCPCYNLVIGRNKSLVLFQQKIGFAIERKMNKLNEARSTIHHYNYVMPPEEELQELCKKGLTQKKIALIYHVTQMSVSLWLRKIGITRGRGWKSWLPYS